MPVLFPLFKVLLTKSPLSLLPPHRPHHNTTATDSSEQTNNGNLIAFIFNSFWLRILSCMKGREGGKMVGGGTSVKKHPIVLSGLPADTPYTILGTRGYTILRVIFFLAHTECILWFYVYDVICTLLSIVLFWCFFHHQSGAALTGKYWAEEKKKKSQGKKRKSVKLWWENVVAARKNWNFVAKKK